MLLSDYLAARHFEGVIWTSAQAPPAAKGWPSSKQHLTNKSITEKLKTLNSIQLGSDTTLRWAKAAAQPSAVIMKLQVALTMQSVKRQASMKAA